MNPLIIVGATAAIAVFAGIRNHWTYEARIELLKQSPQDYLQLPSYYTCFFKFWVWDIKKFIK